MVITILHTADNHLDPKLSYGLKRQFDRKRDFENSFTKVIDFALEKVPDLMLICGDIFDTITPLNPTRMIVIEKLRKVHENGTHIFLISGQHDTTKSVREGSSPIHELKATEFVTYFGQVDAINSKVIDIKGTKLCISGISFNRSLDPNADPLTEIVVPCEGDLNILMLHYSIEGFSGFQESEPIIKIHNIPEQIHYVAGGHIHEFQYKKVKNTLICYPGSTERRTFREVDQKKGFVWLEFNKGQLSNPEFIPLESREMKLIDLALPQKVNLTDFIKQRIDKECHQDIILRMTLKGTIDSESLKTFLKDEIERYGLSKCFDFDIVFGDEFKVETDVTIPPVNIESPIDAFKKYADEFIGKAGKEDKKFYQDVKECGLKFLTGE